MGSGPEVTSQACEAAETRPVASVGKAARSTVWATGKQTVTIESRSSPQAGLVLPLVPVGGDMAGLNANPELFSVAVELSRSAGELHRERDPAARDPLDALEIYDMIRSIKDPEHPHTLEQLRVAQRDLISVDDARGLVGVHFTPTIPHCSMATLIGLCIRVKLLRSLPPRFKVDVNVTPGKHASEHAVNKQLNDKERVAAALENDNLLRTVNDCLSSIGHS